jgi:hypothetical protein
LATVAAFGLATSGHVLADRSAGGPPDSFQVRYASNLNATGGDGFIDITNAGTLSGTHPAGNICVNAYVFDPEEELQECCSCLVTPNALNSWSVKTDLTSNTLTGVSPSSVVIKLVATSANGASNCSASSTLPTTKNLAPGMRAWGTTLHATPTAGTFAVTETEFSPAVLSVSELSELTSTCADIVKNGSGAGICRSCRLGGQ